MQPAPAATLPFDPAPQNTRRETVDRGFADLVARDEPPAKTERPRAEAAKAARQEPPAKTAARPAPDPDESAGHGTVAGHETSGRDTAMAEAVADPAKASQDPEAAATATVAMPAPEATPALPPVTAAPGVVQPVPSADPVAAVAENAPATVETGNPAAVGATAAESPAATDGSGDIAPPTLVPAEAQKSGDAPMQASEKIAARSQAEGAIAPPSPSTEMQTASTAAATGAPRPAGAARDNTGAATPAGPASLAASASGAVKATEGDPSGGQPRNGDGIIAMTGERISGQNKGQEQAFASRSASAQDAVPTANARAGAPDILAAGSEAGQRPDTPATAPGHAMPSTSFANELRTATGATPSPDAAAARMPSGPVIDQMAVQISRALSDGQDKLTIDLRPTVLGRVSVSLELGHDHRVIAVISADRAETLELLQRDVRGLERALQDAGLKTDSGSLSFNLNGDGTKKSPFGDGANAEQLFATQPSDDDGDSQTTTINPYARVLSPTGVDIHV